MTFLSTDDRAELARHTPARRLSRGAGLALGAGVSLALWAGLIFGVLRLIG